MYTFEQRCPHQAKHTFHYTSMHLKNPPFWILKFSRINSNDKDKKYHGFYYNGKLHSRPHSELIWLIRKGKDNIILAAKGKSVPIRCPGKSYCSGRLSTVDLFTLTCFDQLLFIFKILITLFRKTRRSTVLSLTTQLVFPALSVNGTCKKTCCECWTFCLELLWPDNDPSI